MRTPRRDQSDDTPADRFGEALWQATGDLTERLIGVAGLRYCDGSDLRRLNDFDLKARRAALYVIAGLLSFSERLEASDLAARCRDHLAEIDRERAPRGPVGRSATPRYVVIHFGSRASGPRVSMISCMRSTSTAARLMRSSFDRTVESSAAISRYVLPSTSHPRTWARVLACSSG